MTGGLDNPAVVDRRICRDRAERWLQAARRERGRRDRRAVAFAYERALYWARRARRAS